MKVKVTQAHSGEGRFPTFKKGTMVTLAKEGCTHFLHWWPCEIEGYETYVPESFVSNGKLIRDYIVFQLRNNRASELVKGT